MTTRPKSGPQDMPPKGGYGPIQYSRVAIRRFMNPTLATGLTLTSIAAGYTGFFFAYKELRRDQVEMKSAENAIFPLLLAERDREFLKQVRKNRDEEADLMKDYPGWVVGTYFGERIYKGEPEDKFLTPNFHEYTVHGSFAGSAERYTRVAYM